MSILQAEILRRTIWSHCLLKDRDKYSIQCVFSYSLSFSPNFRKVICSSNNKDTSIYHYYVKPSIAKQISLRMVTLHFKVMEGMKAMSEKFREKENMNK